MLYVKKITLFLHEKELLIKCILIESVLNVLKSHIHINKNIVSKY